MVWWKVCLRNRINTNRRGAVWAAFIAMFCVASSISGSGQNRVSVTVDVARTVNVLTDTSLGLPVVSFDANSFNQAEVPYLRAAGITSGRFPGNHGVADLYHWMSRTLTPYHGADAAYFPAESNFPNLALLAGNLGQAVLVVNYGTNQTGSGGGEPVEAAAWVAYANGDPGNTLVLGKDSSGQDWHSVGYWATIRSQAPLAADDGLNILRIQHPQPFGFKLWQVGDEVYNNGYYGGDHAGNPDLHGPAVASPKDISKLKGSPKLSPAAFAENFRQFAQAMKAVDSTIMIGAAFTLPASPDPNNHDWAPDWNKEVLKGACSNLDFVTFDWTMQTLLPPDWKTLNEASLLSNEGYNQTNVIALLVAPMLDDYKRYCPDGHLPRLAFAPAAIATWPKVEHPVVKALWIADFYALLVESGSVNVSWNEMYGDSMLSQDRKNFGTAFYGLQMLHNVAHNPGDLLLDAKSNSPMLAAHAVYRRDGYVGLMLVNKDPKLSANVKVTFKDGTVSGAGRRIDYGQAQFDAGAREAISAFSAPAGEFTVTVAPYTITDILLPGRK
jgi:hypothetical protein